MPRTEIPHQPPADTTPSPLREGPPTPPVEVVDSRMGAALYNPFVWFGERRGMARRRRELLADARGVSLTRYPPGLISALKKLQDDQAVVHQATRATAQLWIESPLDREPGHKGAKLNSAFDTHPPLAERIAILEAM